MLTNSQWNNIENGDTLVTAGGSLFHVVSKIKDGRRDFCVVRELGEKNIKTVHSDDRDDFIDVDKA